MSRRLHIIVRIEDLSERVRVKKLISALADEYAITLVTKSLDQRAKIAGLPNGVTWKELPVKSRSRFAKVTEYTKWIFAVWRYLKRVHKLDIVWLIGFESALPHVLTNRRYQSVFDNADNISMSYRWPRFVKGILASLERRISSVSDVTVIPGKSRDIGFDRVVVLRNAPSLQDISVVQSSGESPNSTVKRCIWRFYLCGWIRRSRGAALVRDALDILFQNRTDFELLIAAAGIETAERDLLSRPYVRYLGAISSSASLLETKRSDFLFAFYDPAIEVNRVAEPNKWIDAITVGTPFFTNYGLLTSEEFNDSGMVRIRYGNSQELADRLLEFMNAPSLYEALRVRVMKNGIPPWEQQITQVIDFLQTSGRGISG